MQRSRPAGLLALCMLVVLLMFSPAPAAMTFGSTATVAPRVLTGEPGIALDPSNAARMYVTAPGIEGVWLSTNSGATFALKAFPSGSVPSNDGDSDVAVDANGTLYQSGLLSRGGLDSTVPVAVSTDQGTTWIRGQELVPNAIGIECDRQWTAARGNGIVVHAARCGNVESGWVSTNSGVSFSPKTIATNVGAAGPLVFAPSGVLYQPYFSGSTIRVARSANNGVTWSTQHVANYTGRVLFWPALDVDSAGNVFVSWSESPVAAGLFYPVPPTSGKVYVARSLDNGTTYGAKQLVSPSSTTAIFPWVTAGGAGKANVSYYAAAAGPGGVGTAPDLGTPLTQWNVEVAQTTNGTAATPSWSTSVAAVNFHSGSICTEGLFCVGPQNAGLLNLPTPFDRRVLDFFETVADAAGNLILVYPKDRPPVNATDLLAPLQPLVDIRITKQTGGTRIRP